MKAGEGGSLKEDLASLPRFGDLSVEWWQPGDPKVVGEFGGLALETAAEIFAQARVAVLERHNGKKRKQAGVPLVRSKHLIAAEDAEGQADRCDHALAPTQNGLPTSLSLEARSKAGRIEARGGKNP